MPTKKTARSRKKSSAKKRVFSPEGQRAQTANQITWRILGGLKNIRKVYLQISVLLATVRDEKLYAALHYPDMEAYAHDRLNLGKSSLYNYLMIHDWASKAHPAWLDPKVKGPKLDFSDVGDLMWIEKELSKPYISENKQAKLLELQQKAMEGNLRQTEVRQLKKPAKTVQNSLKSLISAVRGVRNRAKKLANCPLEVIEHLDAAVEILSNDSALKVAGMHWLNSAKQKWPQIFVA